MIYRVVYTDSVMADISAKIVYLQDQQVSERIIEQWLAGLYDRMNVLYKEPRMYGLDHAATKRNRFEVHKLTYKDHVVQYRVLDDQQTVLVLAFMHGAKRK